MTDGHTDRETTFSLHRLLSEPKTLKLLKNVTLLSNCLTYQVQVRWFYHPAEVEGTAEGGGRVDDLLTQANALFSSSHADENDVQTISHRCSLLDLKAGLTVLQEIKALGAENCFQKWHMTFFQSFSAQDAFFYQSSITKYWALSPGVPKALRERGHGGRLLLGRGVRASPRHHQVQRGGDQISFTEQQCHFPTTEGCCPTNVVCLHFTKLHILAMKKLFLVFSRDIHIKFIKEQNI